MPVECAKRLVLRPFQPYAADLIMYIECPRHNNCQIRLFQRLPRSFRGSHIYLDQSLFYRYTRNTCACLLVLSTTGQFFRPLQARKGYMTKRLSSQQAALLISSKPRTVSLNVLLIRFLEFFLIKSLNWRNIWSVEARTSPIQTMTTFNQRLIEFHSILSKSSSDISIEIPRHSRCRYHEINR